MKTYKQAFKDAKELRNEVGIKIGDFETNGVKLKSKDPGGPNHEGFVRPIQWAEVEETPKGFEVVIDVKANLDPHVLMSPVAAAVTGTDPNDHIDNPNFISQTDLAMKSSRYFQNEVTIHGGYNWKAYDEVVCRHSWHEKLLPAYTLSRLESDIDYYKISESVFATEPSLLNFPIKPNGNVELRQQYITKANGIRPKDPHKAVGDTLTAGEYDHFLKDQAPDHYYAAVLCGSKRRVEERLNNDPFVVYGYVQKYTRQGKVLTLAKIIESASNRVMTFDLSHDPSAFIHLGPDEIAKMLGKKDSPFLDLKTSDDQIFLPPWYCKAANLSETEAAKRSAKISSHFVSKVQKALIIRGNPDWPVLPYSDCQLYSGSWQDDLHLSNDFLHGNNQTRKQLLSHFTDPRAFDFAKRIIAIDQGPEETEIYDEYILMCRTRFFAKSESVPHLTYDGAIAQIDQIIEMGFSEEVVNPIGNYFEDMKEELS